MSVITKESLVHSIMYGDIRISVDAYLDRLETMILLVVNILGSHLHKSK